MPTKYVRKKLIDPNDSDKENPINFLWVPVAQEMIFIDAKTKRQEYVWTLDIVGQDDGRSFVKKRVKNNSSGTLSEDDYVDVARFKWFTIRDSKIRGQEYQFGLDNDTYPLDAGDLGGESPRRKVKIVRYVFQDDENADPDPEATPWVDIEQTEEISVIDSKTRSQEYRYSISWPQVDKKVDSSDDPYEPWLGNVDLTLETVNADSDGVVRLGPFQNIVNVSWSGKAVKFLDGDS